MSVLHLNRSNSPGTGNKEVKIFSTSLVVMEKKIPRVYFTFLAYLAPGKALLQAATLLKT